MTNYTPKPTNTFCSKPFNAIALKNFTGSKLDVAWPCCMMGNRTSSSYDSDKLKIENVHTLTPEEIFKHPRMEQLRQNLLNGVKDSACEVCWGLEDIGVTSFRYYSDVIDDERVQNPKLEDLDITTSTECNLRCRMCSPSSSNKLMIDNKYFKENNLLQGFMESSHFNWMNDVSFNPTASLQWDWLMNNTDKITTLRISGGEPFYDTKTVKLLDKYIETGCAKNTSILGITNGTMMTEDIINKLNQFKWTMNSFSIDGHGKVYDYVRYPSNFEKLDSSVRNYIDKVKNKKGFQINVVVSALNISSMVDYINWGRTLTGNTQIVITQVNTRERGTSLYRLPKFLLEKYLKDMDVFSNTDQTANSLRALLLDAIKNNMENKKMMLGEITPFDLSRNQSYKDYLDPLLVEWLST
jgi:sulfatase maturation enzyme AslB (radical SAM superfamily)